MGPDCLWNEEFQFQWPHEGSKYLKFNKNKMCFSSSYKTVFEEDVLFKVVEFWKALRMKTTEESFRFLRRISGDTILIWIMIGHVESKTRGHLLGRLCSLLFLRCGDVIL